MAVPRFFVEGVQAHDYSVGAIVSVVMSPADLRHAASVLRLRVEEDIELVVRDSWECYRAKIQSISNEQLVVCVLESVQTDEFPFEITLVFGLSKGDKNDTIVRQAVEIGAHQLIPVMFSRSIIRLDEKKRETRGQRLRTIAQSAAQQAHRARVPRVDNPLDFGELVSHIDLHLEPFDEIIILWEEFAGPSLSQYIAAATLARGCRIALVVGPEGGITSQEVESLVSRGAQLASLGPTILRVDTANAVALGVVVDALNRKIVSGQPT